MEARDYKKLVKALRCPDFGDVPCSHPDCNYWSVYACKARVVITDAADAIEALQAQLPKRGEWQKAKPKGVVTYSDGYAECSHCHEAIWLGWGMNFCPHCGTQNKIIDPDDYDGAKMEVQDADTD